MQDLLLEQLQARKERKNYAMVTIVDSFGSTPRTNGKMLVYENGLSKGTVGGGHHEQMAKRDAVACIARGQNALKRYEIKAPAAASGAVCTGGITVFIEVFRAAPLLVDTRDTEIIADSVAMADRFEQVPDFESGLRALDIDPTAYYVLCSYSHATDCASLHAVLDKQWSYAGMVGSRAKIGAIFSQMRELGYSDARLAEVHTPIGLSLGGETPAEIAVAIMAEIIAVQHGTIQNFS